MTKQIFIAFATEGITDFRFLESIIKRTFEDVAYRECTPEIEIFDPIYIKTKDDSKPKKDPDRSKKNIRKKALYCAGETIKNGAMILCFHVDADHEKDENAFNYSINPAFKTISNSNQEVCKNLVAIVPIQKIEAWMLADKELLKKQLGTSENDEYLGINKKPEEFSDPKETIENAIRIARQEFPKRRRKELNISELYQPIGQTINLKELNNLPSYQKFREAVKNSFKQLNYLH